MEGVQVEGLKLRGAVGADYEAVRALMALDFAHHRDARPDYFNDCADYSRADFDEHLGLSRPIAWVAELDGAVIGLCFGRIEATRGSAFCRSRRVAFIEDLVVRPECRGRGVATALLERACAQAREAGAQAVELCVWGFNEGAQRLYRKMGFQTQYVRMELGLAES